jgi:predicted histidine transporter YuiF (NhaC family)
MCPVHPPRLLAHGDHRPGGHRGRAGGRGFPASDSTLGPTSGLNADGQHDHIWDSVVPTFIHYNIPW